MLAGHVSRLYVYICIYMLYHARVHVPCSSVVSQTCMKGGGGEPTLVATRDAASHWQRCKRFLCRRNAAICCWFLFRKVGSWESRRVQCYSNARSKEEEEAEQEEEEDRIRGETECVILLKCKQQTTRTARTKTTRTTPNQRRNSCNTVVCVCVYIYIKEGWSWVTFLRSVSRFDPAVWR